MEAVPMLEGLLGDYVLPYWPWILGAIAALLVIRWAMRRVVSQLIGWVAAVVLAGVLSTGGTTWLSDRGLEVPHFGFW